MSRKNNNSTRNKIGDKQGQRQKQFRPGVNTSRLLTRPQTAPTPPLTKMKGAGGAHAPGLKVTLRPQLSPTLAWQPTVRKYSSDASVRQKQTTRPSHSQFKMADDYNAMDVLGTQIEQAGDVKRNRRNVEDLQEKLAFAEDKYTDLLTRNFNSFEHIYEEIRGILLPLAESPLPPRRDEVTCESVKQEILAMIDILKKEIRTLCDTHQKPELRVDASFHALGDNEKATDSPNQLQKENDNLKTKVQEGRNKIEEMRITIHRVKQINERLSKANKENQIDTTNLSNSLEQKIEELQEQIATNESNFDQERANLKQKMEEQGNAMVGLQQESDVNKQRCLTLSKQHSSLGETCQRLKKDIGEYTRVITEQKDCIAELGRCNSGLRTEIKHRDESLKRKDEELHKERSQSEQGLGRDEVAKLQQDNKLIEKKLEAYKAKVTELENVAKDQKQMECYHKEKDQTIKELESLMAGRDQELNELKTKIALMKEQFDESSIAAKDDQARTKSHSEKFNSDVRYYREELSRREEQMKEWISEQEQHMKVVREEGMNVGFSKGITENSDELNRLQSKTVEQDEQICQLTSKLAKSETSLRQTMHQKAKQANESHKPKQNDAQQHISQLKATNPRQGGQDLIYELQERLAINESNFDQERSNFQHEIEQLKQELRRNHQQYQTLSEEHSRNVDRLAAEMNAKVSSDESALENISIQARPMTIAEDYNLLLSNAWLDAKSVLDQMDTTPNITESEKVILLFNVLMVCEQEAIAMYEQIVKQLGKTLRDPLIKLIPSDSRSTTQEHALGTDAEEPGSDLPQNLMTVVGDYFRSHSSTANIELLYQHVISALKTKYGHKVALIRDSIGIKEVMNFVTDSARLAWKMVIQRPPMSFDASHTGQPWDTGGISEVIWGSDPLAPGAVIQYYKAPALFHAGNAMVKGKVFVHSANNPQK